MKILMASRYVQPKAKHFNANVVRQALALKSAHGVNVEIVTWPGNDFWEGPVPAPSTGLSLPPIFVEAGGLTFHVINPPAGWDERPPSDSSWSEAVEFGVRLLEKLQPDVLHLQHWSGLWWLLESAQRVGIATVYSNHDWGIACLRTILVKGDGSLCDGHVSVDKCGECIWQGRNLVGKANELVASSGAGRMLIEAAFKSPLKPIFEQRGAVRLPARTRVEMNLRRSERVLRSLDSLVTPSRFGKAFFSRLGVPDERIRVMPWYHDPVSMNKTVTSSQPFTITYIGRVSQEKGVHQILAAMARVRSAEPVELRIAGANSSAYCQQLRSKYASSAGAHPVRWLGWSEVEPLFLSTDVCVIPSVWIDNTPLSLIEAMSYRVPVVATRVPPIEELVKEGENGYLAEFMSVDSLARAIERAIADKARIRAGEMVFPRVDGCREYTRGIKEVYSSVAR